MFKSKNGVCSSCEKEIKLPMGRCAFQYREVEFHVNCQKKILLEWLEKEKGIKVN